MQFIRHAICFSSALYRDVIVYFCFCKLQQKCECWERVMLCSHQSPLIVKENVSVGEPVTENGAPAGSCSSFSLVQLCSHTKLEN